MTRQRIPTARGGLVTQEPERIGGAARGWLWLSRLLADRWNGERPRDAVRLWLDAQSDAQLPLSIRIRAATAIDLTR